MRSLEVIARRTLAGVPPHDLERCFGVFFEPSGQIRSYQDGVLRHVLDLKDSLLLVDIVPTGSVDEPSVDLVVRGRDRLGGKRLDWLVELVSRMINLRLDLKPFYLSFADDPVIGRLTRQMNGLKPVRTQTMYESLVVSILGQQISVAAAASMQRRLVDRFGEKLTFASRTYRSFPRPERLSAATIGELMECALSTRKAEYIRDVSRQVAKEGLDLEGLGELEDSEEVIQRLVALRGIGRWTAELAAIRGLGRYDVVPADDVGLRRTVSRFYGLKPASGEDIRRIADSWGRWKGMATYYLYVASRLRLATEVEERGE